MSEADPLIPVEEAARRLGVSVESVLRYARRNKWRKVRGGDGVLVAVPAVAFDKLAKRAQPKTRPPIAAAEIAAIVQAAVAPLQAALDRSDGDRRILQK